MGKHQKAFRLSLAFSGNFAGRSAKQVGSHEDKGTGGTKHQKTSRLSLAF